MNFINTAGHGLSRFKLACALLLFPFLNFTDAYANALDNWTSNPINDPSVSSNAFGLGSIAYGNGLYVAVGSTPLFSDFGIIMTSSDGQNWTRRTFNSQTNSTYSLGKVIFANGTFIAVGYLGSIYRSTNGIDWALTQLGPLYNFHDVAYGNGLFVAVGDNEQVSFPSGSSVTATNIYTSPDGITWTPRRSTITASAARSIYSIVYDGNKFIAIGEGSTAGGGGYTYTSTDAITWARNTVGFNGINSPDVASGNGITIITDGSTNVFVSPSPLPGIPPVSGYATLDTGTGLRVSSILFASGMFIGLGFDLNGNVTNLVCSRNGVTWTKSSVPPDKIRGMTSLGNRLAAVGFTSGPPLQSTLYLSGPFVDLGLQFAGSPQLQVSGIIGRTYQIEYLDAPLASGSNNWQALTNFVLPSSPYTWKDMTGTNSSQRLYRALLLP